MTRLRGEEGVALAISLAFLSFFGLVGGMLLGFAETASRSTIALREQTQRLYALGGAVDGAINAIRGNVLYGRDPSQSAIPCPTNTFTAGGVTVSVTCTGEPGSGGASSGGPAPDHAVLSVSTDAAEHGFEQVSTTGVTVNGSIFSHTDVLNSGTASVMTVQGDLEAIGNCTAPPPAQIVVTGTKRCANEPVQADPAHGLDPGWSPVTATVPGYRVAPACPGPNQLVTLVPGTYTDAAALNALTNGSCSGTVLHLPADASGVGAYYFDFRNAGSHEWTISDPTVNVVGGTKKGWIELPGARPVLPYPGACKVEGDAAPNDGIQVLFGGDSRVKVSGGKVELCPQPSATAQEIALYGVRSGSATPVSSTLTADVASSVAGFINPDNAKVIEGGASPQTSDATLSLAAPTATLGLAKATGLPQGAYITSAKLRIAHDEGTDASSVETLNATVTVHGVSQTVSIPTRTTYTEDLLDLTGLVGQVGPAAGVSIAISAVRAVTLLTPDPTVKIDGAVLEVTYEPIAFRAQSGCIVARPYVSGSVTTCAVLQGTGAAGIAIQGTVYAPLAPIDVEVINASTQIFNRGIVARLSRLGISPAAGFAGAPVGIVRADRVVSFSGTAGATTLVARATFEDGGGLTPGQTVTVDRWTIRR